MRAVLLTVPFLILTGCGLKGPLTMPANPDDSYLSRIEKSLNDMTGQDSAAPEQNAQTDFVVEPAEGSEEYVEPQTQKDILTPASDKNYDPLNSRRRMPQHVGTY